MVVISSCVHSQAHKQLKQTVRRFVVFSHSFYLNVNAVRWFVIVQYVCGIKVKKGTSVMCTYRCKESHNSEKFVIISSYPVQVNSVNT